MKVLVVFAFSAAATMMAATITNPSFETPALGTGNFQYNPAGATWTFVGQSGIAANGSSFGFANAPDGTQVAFLQVFGSTSSSFSQTITGVNVGDTISFFDALRPGFLANSFNVLYNGTLLGSFTPGSTTFTKVSVTIPVGSPSSGVLNFQSTGATGGDRDLAIDLVSGASTSAVPEPNSALLLVSMVAGLFFLRRKLGAALLNKG